MTYIYKDVQGENELKKLIMRMRGKNEQLKLDLHDYGVNAEQVCIMCHLSAEDTRCQLKIPKLERRQLCAQDTKDVQGSRWESWMYLVSKGQPLHELVKYIPRDLRKKYKI